MRRAIFLAMLIQLVGAVSAQAYGIEAETFDGGVVRQAATASSGALLLQTESGAAVHTATVPATDRITVRARGGQNCNGWPHMTLAIDGNTAVDVEVAQLGWADYSADVNLPAGQHTFAIGIDNAFTDGVSCSTWLRTDLVTGHEATPAPWRAFADSSIWNTPAQQTGSSNPNAGLFASYDCCLILGGGPAGSSSHDRDYAKPFFYAKPGDPVVPVRETEPTWVTEASGVKVPARLELPAGATWAKGSDGHMGIFSSDMKMFCQFWRVTQANASGIVATDGSCWALTGDGSSAKQGSGVQDRTGSAGGRGSGTPLVTTTLTPEDALNGVNHALGVTVPRVSSSFIYPPATKSDGSCGCAIKYGQRYVLRADYPEGPRPVGQLNVIRALKVYGMIVVDQGASFEIDTTGDYRPGEAQMWASAGINRTALNDIKPADLRPAQ